LAAVASPRVRRLDEAGKRRLVEVAIRHFAAHGLDRASLNEIIAEAGISKGSYYHHFEDKRALFLEALRIVVDQLLAEAPLPPVPKSARTYWQEIRAHNDRVLEALLGHPELVAFFGSFRRMSLADPAFDSLRADGRELYLPILRAGQRLGCVRKDVPLEMLASIWEAADVALDQRFMGHPRPFTKARLAAHADLAFDTFRRIFEARGHRTRAISR
jgi:AcrR family transcriptional regulator